MNIFILVIWIIAGFCSGINYKSKDYHYWKCIFWLTYVSLIITLLGKTFYV